MMAAVKHCATEMVRKRFDGDGLLFSVPCSEMSVNSSGKDFNDDARL
jgi:site-specific DNA-cytosine methylase